MPQHQSSLLNWELTMEIYPYVEENNLYFGKTLLNINYKIKFLTKTEQYTRNGLLTTV